MVKERGCGWDLSRWQRIFSEDELSSTPHSSCSSALVTSLFLSPPPRAWVGVAGSLWLMQYGGRDTAPVTCKHLNLHCLTFVVVLLALGCRTGSSPRPVERHKGASTWRPQLSSPPTAAHGPRLGPIQPSFSSSVLSKSRPDEPRAPTGHKRRWLS